MSDALHACDLTVAHVHAARPLFHSIDPLQGQRSTSPVYRSRGQTSCCRRVNESQIHCAGSIQLTPNSDTTPRRRPSIIQLDNVQRLLRVTPAINNSKHSTKVNHLGRFLIFHLLGPNDDISVKYNRHATCYYVQPQFETKRERNKRHTLSRKLFIFTTAAVSGNTFDTAQKPHNHRRRQDGNFTLNPTIKCSGRLKPCQLLFFSAHFPPRKYNQLEILQQKSSPPPQPEIIIRVPHRNNTRSRRSVRPTHTRPVTFSVCGLSIIPLKRQSNTLPACIAFEPSIIAGRMRTRVNAQLAQLQSTVAIFIRLQGGGGGALEPDTCA